ncbi:MAG: branched-chain amino acid ABC transporter permease [Verrucomicrobia bacterium]|nr:branched-chain amino acid ABC transporter permease [Verrucomicrobiota bacterium]
MKEKLLLLAALVVSLLVSLVSDRINPYHLDILLGIGINITLAVSLNLINGYTGQFSMGHAGFMAVGAYIGASVTTFAGPTVLAWFGGAKDSVGVPALFLAALVAGGLGAALAGLVVGVPSLRLRGDYLAIVTLGFGEIIRVILQNIQAVGGPTGMKGIAPYTTVFWTFAWAALTVYCVLALVHSTYGRGFIAVHDDEIAAAAMGINTTRYKVAAFVIGAFFAGVAGGLYAHLKSFISPGGFDFMKSFDIVVMVILGGMGNTLGVVLAAILLTVLPEVLRPVAEYRMILYSLLIIIIMLVRPQGLFTFKWKPRHATTTPGA